MIIRKTITLQQVLASLEEPDKKHIYYSARTCWWTHDPADAHVMWEGQLVPITSVSRENRLLANALPLDCQAAPLFQTEQPLLFVDDAIKNESRYGRHGIRAFMASHAKNCFRHDGRTAYASPSWEEYNIALDYNGVTQIG